MVHIEQDETRHYIVHVLGEEKEGKLALRLLVSLFTSKKHTDPKKQPAQQRNTAADVLNNIYEKCLVS